MCRSSLNHRSWNNSRSLNHRSRDNSRSLNYRSWDNSRSLNHRSAVKYRIVVIVSSISYSAYEHFLSLLLNSIKQIHDFVFTEDDNKCKIILHHEFTFRLKSKTISVVWFEVFCFFRRAFIQISIMFKTSFHCSFLVFFIFFDAFFFSLRRTLSIHKSLTFKINFKSVRRWFYWLKITFSILEFIEINE